MFYFDHFILRDVGVSVRLCLMVLFSVLSACSNVELISTEKDDIPNIKPSEVSYTDKELFCSNEWFHYIEGQLHANDLQGHGPDLGSLEWQLAVEFKLNLVNESDLPKKSTPQWCEYIQQRLNDMRKLPSLSCQEQTLNKIQKTICTQPNLAKLDDELKIVFKTVLSQLNNDLHSGLKAEQRSWIKDLDECSKRESLISCLQSNYQYRIAELQARYELLEGIEPLFYVCNDRPSDEIIVKFYPTSPASLMAERGDQTAFMLLQESDNGALFQGSVYEGRHQRFWEHHGAARVTWAVGSEEMSCEKMH